MMELFSKNCCMKVHETKKRQIKYALDNFAKKIVYWDMKDYQQYHIPSFHCYLSHQITLTQVQETKSCKTSVETDTDELLERSMLLSNVE